MNRFTDNPMVRLLLAAAFVVVVAIALDPRLQPWRGHTDVQSATAVGGHSATGVLGQADLNSGGANRGGSAAGDTLYNPGSVLDDGNGRLFVADSSNHRVLVYDISDGLTDGEAAINVLGQPDFTTTTQEVSQDGMDIPVFLAYDAADSLLFVTDEGNHRVLVFDVSGITDGEAAVNVLGQPDFTSNGFDVDQDSFGDSVRGLAYDSTTDRLFVADTENHRVLVFDVSGITDGEAAINVLGQPDFISNSAETDQDSLYVPGGLALDVGGQRLFVAETNNHRITVFDVSGITDGEAAVNVLGQPDFFTNTPETDQNSLDLPMGVAYDAVNDRLFSSELFFNHRVLVWDVAAITDGENAADVIGHDDFVTSGSGTSPTALDYPYGIWYSDADELLYIADNSNSRIVTFPMTPPPPTPTPDVHLASDALGQLDGSDLPDYTVANIDNGATEPAGRFYNSQIALDTVDHRLFVVDSGNNRVLVFNLDVSDRLVDEEPDAVLGQSDFDTSSSTFPPTATSLSGPEGVAYHTGTKLLFVAEGSGRRVMVWDLSGGITNGMAASYLIGQTTFSGTTSALDARHVEYPGSLALDEAGSRLFVEDAGSGHSRVMVFDVSPANLASEAMGLGTAIDAINVLGQASFTVSTSACTQSKFSAGDVSGLAYDPSSGYLYASNAFGNRILVFDVNAITNGENAVNVLGQTVFTACGNTWPSVTATGFLWVHGMGLAQGPPTLLFVSDNDRIAVFDVSAITNGEAAIAVLGDSDLTGTEALNDNLGALGPGFAYDATNDYLFVSDTDNGVIGIYDASTLDNGESRASVLGSPYRDQAGYGTSIASDPQTNDRGFWGPSDTALDAVNHRLFVADARNHRVLVFNLSASDLLEDRIADNVLGQEDMTGDYAGTSADRMDTPTGVTYDAVNNRLYVADHWNHRVLVFDVSTITDGQDAAYVLGQSTFTSSIPDVTDSRMDRPTDVVIEPTSNVLAVSDTGNNRILLFDTAALSNGMAAGRVFGQADFTSESSGLSDNQVNAPTGVLADTINGYLWAADTGNARVLAFNLTDLTGASAVLVLGQPDMYTSSPATTQQDMVAPRDITIVPISGVGQLLYVSDPQSNRVLVFDGSAGYLNYQEASDVYGQSTFDGDTATTAQDGLSGPAGLAYDSVNEALWVTDTDNHRVLHFVPGAVPTSPPPGGGGGGPRTTEIGFYPDKIEINDDEPDVGDRNVLVTIHAHFSDSFEGTVDVLLSNRPDFETFVPFRYNIPDQRARSQWPKTVAWDLCLGLPEAQPCEPGSKTVYARFYVNVPPPAPRFITNTQ